uniref:Uncharacterized protein n=1 Tax=Arundo donax TaxID=35708 RepID=A0A0A9BBX2_ARUDO
MRCSIKCVNGAFNPRSTSSRRHRRHG